MSKKVNWALSCCAMNNRFGCFSFLSLRYQDIAEMHQSQQEAPLSVGKEETSEK